MIQNIIVAMLIVLSHGGGGVAPQAADIADQIVDGIQGVIDGIVDTATSVGSSIGNVVDGAIRDGTRSAVMGSGDYADERRELNTTTDALETAANSHSDKWVVKDNVTTYRTINVMVVKHGVGIAKHSVRMNWTNRSMNITGGFVDDADLTVYVQYRDIKFVERNWTRIINGDGTSSDATRLWAIWRDTGCTPNDVCTEIRGSYVDYWSHFLGWLS